MVVARILAPISAKAPLGIRLYDNLPAVQIDKFFNARL
jgi:hypothetical protein